MKSLKITAIITGLVLICNIASANQNLSLKFFKFTFFKSTFSAWKAKDINKYKFLAPVFPKEIPVEEPVSSAINSGSINDDNVETVGPDAKVAPSFPGFIPADEEIYIFSPENTGNYTSLAPIYEKEIDSDEAIQISRKNGISGIITLYDSFENPGYYKHLAPEFPKEIPAE